MTPIVIQSQRLSGAVLFNNNFISTYLLFFAVSLPFWRKMSTTFWFLFSQPYKYQKSNFATVSLVILDHSKMEVNLLKLE